MATFSFRAPNGDTFEVQAPAGVSEAQARALFEQQLAAGSLTNLQPGQTIDAAKQALSSINSVSGALAKLENLPVSTPIDTAKMLTTIPATLPVGSLDTKQVTGLLASAQAAVGQPFDAVSANKGIGQFGMTPAQLEAQGFLKPGSVNSFIANQPPPEVTEQDLFEAERINREGGDITPEQVASNRQLNSVLSNGSLWTGKSGVGGLDQLLSNPSLQTITQNNIMDTSLKQLKVAGAVTGKESPQELATAVQTATKFGTESAVSWIKGKAGASEVAQIQNIAKDAQYAMNFVQNKLGNISSFGQKIKGFTNTVNRATVDVALKDIIGDAKIPTPNFDTGLYSNTPDADLTYEGDDPIVRDRVNQERARRGLPPLPEPDPLDI